MIASVIVSRADNLHSMHWRVVITLGLMKELLALGTLNPCTRMSLICVAHVHGYCVVSSGVHASSYVEARACLHVFSL
jgi:hypothetical protein